MRQSPEWKEFPKYPVIAGTALFAIGVTFAWWGKADVSALFENAMIRRGEWWRLITSIFPHLSLWHLIFNIYWLWIFGTLIEEVFGHLKTAALIAFLALGSGALEFAFSDGGVGLSGVGYGFFGLLWVLSREDDRFRDAIDGRTIQLFVAWFFICIVTTMTKIMMVGNIAHGTGAVLGALIGFAIAWPRRRIVIAAGLVGIMLLGIWGATLGRPRINMSSNGGYEEGQLGFAALQANRNQEAVKWFADAAIYQPNTAAYWMDLAIAHERLGNESVAFAHFRKAAELGDPSAQIFLATTYEVGGKTLPKDPKQSLYWFRKAADQNNAEAQNSVAWTLATSSDPSVRDPGAALEYARKAVNSEKDQPVATHLDTLAESYYANREYKMAVSTEEQAIASASPEESAEFQNSLQKYKQALGNGESQLKAKMTADKRSKD